MSITFWTSNQVSLDQQNAFLAAAGLEAMPDASAMSDAQWKTLAGVVGEDTVRTIRESTGPLSLSSPRPAFSSAVGDWSKILMLIGEIRAKMGDAMSSAAAKYTEMSKNSISEIYGRGMELLTQSLFAAETAMAAAEIDVYVKVSQDAFSSANAAVASCEQQLELLQQQANAEDPPANISESIASAKENLTRLKQDAASIGQLAENVSAIAEQVLTASTSDILEACVDKAKDTAQTIYTIQKKDFAEVQFKPEDAVKTPQYGKAVQGIIEAVALLNSTGVRHENVDLRRYIIRVGEKITDEVERLGEMLRSVDTILFEADDMLRESDSAVDNIHMRNSM